MTDQIGQLERATQARLINLFQHHLGYTYWGNWHTRPHNSHIEEDQLSNWLTSQGVSQSHITAALHQLHQASAISGSTTLYEANRAVYRLLRYGVKVKASVEEKTQTVWLINWQEPTANLFAIAEEVTIAGIHNKRPDIVLYINGIAIGVIELKSPSTSVGDGIRQNLDNQKKEFIRSFFATMQLVMAGNDTEGLRYATIETPEKYYLAWKEENPTYDPNTDDKSQRYLPNAPCDQSQNLLDCAVLRLLNKSRLIELLHDFIIFDFGIKKVPRPNQYFGVKAAQKRLAQREGGIIWHTQGSGKSLTMVWLAKWIRENISHSRVLILTDRTHLDEQIEGVFTGVGETIYRTTSGADLLQTLDDIKHPLICSLVHKFGSQTQHGTTDFIAELQKNITPNFSPKGNIFVFIDECHRTQSGKLHEAMKHILPNALFIGFTGTPLLKKDKKTSIETFGPFIHTYKFDEAVADGVVLDLRYEARDIDQMLTSPKRIDQWFESKTRALTDIAKVRLKQKWGTMQKVLSSRSRLSKIVADILMDMENKERLQDGRGNAMLVCSSIYEACKVYELLQDTDLAQKCAIITSYKPSPADIKGEESGQGVTEQLKQYQVYRRMLANFFDESEETAMYKTAEFEKQVKKRFIDHPGQMKLLVVVDKLLTGFDAPSATYLYIDKTMRDHGLFQAICRVNRLDGDDKEYGFIIDYQDLFHSLEGAISDYTSGAFDQYEASDVQGLLSNRLTKGRERLEETREQVKAICEPVQPPKAQSDYFAYFSAVNNADGATIRANEGKRVALYKAVASLIRAYVRIANELAEAGYTPTEIQQIRQEVKKYEKLRREIEMHSGDYIDLKQYESAMRHMIDQYIRAEESEKVVDFEELGLIRLFVKDGESALDNLPEGIRESEQATAETIENNLRRIILDEQEINPKYYGEMSELLDELIHERKTQAIAYKTYLERFKQIATKVTEPTTRSGYPNGINTQGRQALYDELGGDADLTRELDQLIQQTKRHDWVGNSFKERQLGANIHQRFGFGKTKIDELIAIIREQHEYK